MALFIPLIIILALIGFIGLIVTIVQTGLLTLRAAEAATNVPDWIGTNFISWVLFIIGLFIVLGITSAIIRVAILIVSSLTALILTGITTLFSKDGYSEKLGIILGVVVAVILRTAVYVGIIIATVQFFDFAAQFPHYNEYYANAGIVGIILHSMFFLGALLPSNNSNSED